MLWLIRAGLGESGRGARTAPPRAGDDDADHHQQPLGIGETHPRNHREQGGRHDQARHRGTAQRQIEGEPALLSNHWPTVAAIGARLVAFQPGAIRA